LIDEIDRSNFYIVRTSFFRLIDETIGDSNRVTEFTSIVNNYCFSVLASYPSYNSINSSSSQPTTNDKPTVNTRVESMNPYPPFFNIIPPINFSLPSSSSIPYHSIPSKISKRPRLTAHIRSEILKLKANKATIFVWEIQQNLLQNGICTTQTLPNVSLIFYSNSSFFCSLGESYSTTPQ
jgi:hypothetical protein